MDELERTVLTALLDGSHPALQKLRQQLATAEIRSRERIPSGQFVDFWVPDEVTPLDVGHRFAIDDVYGTLAGMREETAFLLHVVRGRLKTLEAFVLGEEWPEEPALERSWYVAPDPGEAGQLRKVEARDLGFALRGLQAEGDEG